MSVWLDQQIAMNSIRRSDWVVWNRSRTSTSDMQLCGKSGLTLQALVLHKDATTPVDGSTAMVNLVSNTMRSINQTHSGQLQQKVRTKEEKRDPR